MVAQPAPTPDCALGDSPASAAAPAVSPPLPGSAGRGQGEGGLPPPLPSLSPPDAALLVRLLTLNENYIALGAELATDKWDHLGEGRPRHFLDLYQWAERPDIATWIDRHHQHQDHHSRRLAIIKLESLITAAASEVEQRRAATTLLRALDHKWPANRRPDRQGGRPASPPSYLPPKLSTLTPSITPDPAHSPLILATTLARDLSEDFYEQAICTIQAIVAPGAPIGDRDFLDKRVEPIPILSDQPQFSDPIPFKHDPMFAEGQKLTITDPLTRGRFTLSFVRSYLGPWRLYDINSG